MLSIGALWLILWQGRLRNFGPIMMAASFMIWALDDRPLVLIADNGSLLGVMTDQGRALSKEKGQGLLREIGLKMTVIHLCNWSRPHCGE